MLLTIAINVGNTENKLPSGKIIFNNNVIHSGEYNKNTFVLPQIVGTNELSISLDNKQDKDTIMKGNQIVEDVFVVVKDLKCEITNDSLNDFWGESFFRVCFINEGEEVFFLFLEDMKYGKIIYSIEIHFLSFPFCET